MKVGDVVYIKKDKFGKGRDEVWIIEKNSFNEPEEEEKYYAVNKINSCREIKTNKKGQNYFTTDGTEIIIITK